MKKHRGKFKAQMFKDGTEPAISLNHVLYAVCFHYTSYEGQEKRRNNFWGGLFYFQNLIAIISNATPPKTPRPTFAAGVRNGFLTPPLLWFPEGEPSCFCKTEYGMFTYILGAGIVTRYCPSGYSVPMTTSPVLYRNVILPSPSPSPARPVAVVNTLTGGVGCQFVLKTYFWFTAIVIKFCYAKINIISLPFTVLKKLIERWQNYFFFFLHQVTDKLQYEARQMAYNVLRLCEVA